MHCMLRTLSVNIRGRVLGCKGIWLQALTMDPNRRPTYDTDSFKPAPTVLESAVATPDRVACCITYQKVMLPAALGSFICYISERKACCAVHYSHCLWDRSRRAFS